MLACFAFLLMAVNVYQLPMASIMSHLRVVVASFLLVIGGAALLGWLLAVLRKRRR